LNILTEFIKDTEHDSGLCPGHVYKFTYLRHELCIHLINECDSTYMFILTVWICQPCNTDESALQLHFDHISSLSKDF
jgi:hypothetical protein